MTVHQLAALFLSLGALAVASAASGQQAADPYAEALGYQTGQPRTALAAIEAELRAASPAQLPELEDKLLKILQSSQASTDAKAWVCRQLRHMGSEKSAAALAGLLAEGQLETIARWALQSIPGEQVDAALRAALDAVPTDLKAGVLQTIGARRDRHAVAVVARLAGDPNPAVAEAALYALGQIGGADALAAIQTATVPPGLQQYRQHAVLRCAERLADDGQAAESAKLYRRVFGDADDDAVIRTAALRGVLLAEKAQAADFAIAALQDGDAGLRMSAAKLVCEGGCPKLIGAVFASLPTLPAATQAALLELVNDPTALPAVTEAARRGDEAVRAAALGALGRVGDAASVALLLETATGDRGAPQAAARQSLARVRGAEVDATLAAAAQAGELRQRTEAIRALAARSVLSATPVLLKLAEDADEAIRIEAWRALGDLASAQTLPALVKLLAAAPSAGQRQAAEQALIAVCQRAPDPDSAAASVSAGLPGAIADVRGPLLRVLARVPSDRSLEVLRAAAQDADPAVRDTAIRGLADWPDARAIADLPQIARTAESLPHKVLALRGLIRMAGLPGGRAPAETAALLGEALTLAPRPEEKKAALAALGDVAHPAALELAGSCLTDKDLEVEAAVAVVKIAKRVQSGHPDRAKAAVQRILELATKPAARQVAESAWFVIGSLLNVAPQGKASSPDDVEKDGAASGDQAAIDGNPATYWDEADGNRLYRLVVTLPQPERIAAISVMGYEQHRFAPRDFEIICDGKTVQKIESAQYEDNVLVVKLDPVTCTTIELKITGCYGGSPAIRELGIYRPQ
ncbi:MAG: hypothetical protein GX575_17155 [Candidatus Anammoximicrobium sp.]|nr:hypothetical protein [Candidatus Anammoximicrobium sp.]